MKKVEIVLDDKSLEILDELEGVHKQSMINFGLRLVAETDYYKILTGKEIDIKNLERNLDSINEISLEKNIDNSKKETNEKKEETKNDILDLGDFM